ncbi:hypothetical protein ACFQU3_11510 [Terrabacter sp. GCM10028922]|uniref:hypothetical protein n=1 Tax=Terrabacter sp. GCM10028922 TaxID=3273428 RepID=UPI003606884D
MALTIWAGAYVSDRADGEAWKGVVPYAVVILCYPMTLLLVFLTRPALARLRILTRRRFDRGGRETYRPRHADLDDEPPGNERRER